MTLVLALTTGTTSLTGRCCLMVPLKVPVGASKESRSIPPFGLVEHDPETCGAPVAGHLSGEFWAKCRSWRLHDIAATQTLTSARRRLCWTVETHGDPTTRCPGRIAMDAAVPAPSCRRGLRDENHAPLPPAADPYFSGRKSTTIPNTGPGAQEMPRGGKVGFRNRR